MLKNFAIMLSLSTSLITSAAFAMNDDDENKKNTILAQPIVGRTDKTTQVIYPCTLNVLSNDVLKIFIAHNIEQNPAGLNILRSCKKLRLLGQSPEVVSHVVKFVFDKGMSWGKKIFSPSYNFDDQKRVNKIHFKSMIEFLARREHPLAVFWLFQGGGNLQEKSIGLEPRKSKFFIDFMKKNGNRKYAEENGWTFKAETRFPVFCNLHPLLVNNDYIVHGIGTIPFELAFGTEFQTQDSVVFHLSCRISSRKKDAEFELSPK